ncbi:MAG: PilZ domain-containing protein, partial [Desulfobulbaceae bacterium]|nr:PilZ domain-containing protein [Desulfobulbaceae bacterium]
LLLIVGLVDDYKGLGHWQKFVAQGLAVWLMVSLDNLSLHTFGNLLGLGEIAVSQPALSVAITFFCVIGVINAINMIDGLDGLAGGVSFIAFCSFAVMAALNGHESTMLLCVAIAGAIFGYLRYNWRPAKIFMGDAGSLILGFSLAYMTLKLTQLEGSTVAPVCALLSLAVPITDTLVLMTRRAMQGKNPFRADCYHLHHLLLRHVLNKKNTVKVILTLTVFFNVISVMATFIDAQQHYLFLGYVIYFLLVFRLSFLQSDLLRLRLKFKRKRQLNSDSVLLKFLSSLAIKFLSVIPLFRDNPRYNTSMPVKCHASTISGPCSCEIVNISTTGCQIITSEVQFKCNELELEIPVRLKNKKEDTIVLTLTGKDAWFNAGEKNTYRHGIQFTGLKEEETVILEEFIDQLAREQNRYGGLSLRGRLATKAID